MTTRMDRIIWYLKQERPEIWYSRRKESKGHLTTQQKSQGE